MNSFIDPLNYLGARFADFALAMFVQSSLLIVLLFALDLVLRNRVRAVVRYALWMLVLIKLVLPPSFAAPTSLAYWLSETKAVKTTPASSQQFVVRYSDVKFDGARPLPSLPPPRAKLQFAGWLLLAWLATAVGLMAWLVRRSRSVVQTAARAFPASASPEQLLDACRQQMGIKQQVRLKLSGTASSPAVCGVWRPVILIPQQLADKLSALQLRAVLFHELAHIKRSDALVHYLQTLLQIIYWWHPLLWFANAQIRRVREQAVDEAVVVAMGSDAEAYLATLLDVAKLAFNRPTFALGLIGIVESKSALAQRVQHLLNRPIPKSARLGFTGLAALFLAGAAFLPMARGQRTPNQPQQVASESGQPQPVVAMDLRFIENSPKSQTSNTATSSERQVATTRFASSTGQDVEIEAVEPGTIQYDSRTGMCVVTNDTVVRFNGAVLTARRVQVNAKTGEVIAEGGVTLQRGDQVLRAERLQYNFDALEAIVQTADKPIRCSIEDYAVIFSQNQPGTAHLETRAFHVDPKAFIQHLQNNFAGAMDSQQLVRRFFTAIGVDVLPPNMVFINDRRGTLMVRATPQELRRVQDAIEYLSFKPVERTETEEPPPDNPTGALETRVYKLDLYVLRRNLQELNHDSSVSNGSSSLSDLVRKFMQAHNVTFHSPKTMFLNEQTGALLVRTTSEEFEIVQRIVMSMNTGKVAEDLGFLPPVNEAMATKPIQPDPDVASETRTFRLNSTAFLQALQKGADTSRISESTNAASELLLGFLAAAGVRVTPPNRVFFNHGTGVLMLRASAQELDLAQKAIEVLNVSPPQITIEGKFMELPTEAARQLGLELPPPDRASNTWTRILTAAQTRAVLHAAKQHAGVDILSAPKVTTLSGRQTQIQAVEIKTFVNGIAPEALAPPGVQSTNSNPAQPYLTSQVPCGPTLDLVPYVAADGYTIHLTALPQVTEFLRYDTTLIDTWERHFRTSGRQQKVPIPRPVIRQRSMHAAVDVYDGQTVVLANPQVTVVSKEPTGESVTNAVAEDAGKRLLVFITATLIDPAGNPIHTSGHEPWSDQTPSQQP